ncbi:MAG: four helix bundle protein [candidate division WOR-3 bacterium]
MVNVIKDYKDLKVWRKALEVATAVIELVDLLPPGKAAEIIGEQIISSSTSVCANIAEGHSSGSSKEYNRILRIAYREAKETDNWLQVIKGVKKFPKNTIQERVRKIEDNNLIAVKMLSSLKKKIADLTQSDE